jgi:CxxC motif-containing protein (DUF1111 family)
MWSWLAAWWGAEVLEVTEAVLFEQSEVGPDGGELFSRVWVPGDPRSVAGDGLGPTYNAQSCVACHQQGGAGGAGAQHTNVHLALVGGKTQVQHRVRSRASMGGLGPRGGVFMTGLFGAFEVDPQRNTPALWGLGLIDAVPEAELVAVALAGDPEHPEISGRVSRDERGRAGRFGWKGQTATLASFVEAACAGELGLETAAVSQPGRDPSGPDLSDEQLQALTGFVSGLPRPIEREVPGRELGRQRFEEVGCGSCHRASLGGIEGLYSDLLLHEMGPELADATSSYRGQQEALPAHELAATAREWRTPPLWGLADSAPYLHDGSAETIAGAVGRHGGEAELVRQAWSTLTAQERLAIEAFLMSLSAPGA